DVSPENLMITRDETVKIIDLGVAKVDDVSEVAATRTGIFVGKLRYASPEQLGLLNEDEKIDGRADVYATAMVLYELLMGRPPYEAKSPHEYFLIHTREQDLAICALPAEMPGSAALQAVLRRALARDRNQRYASAKEFAVALEEIERALPDPQAMPTMATPLDGDETMRLRSQTGIDTLPRETVRTAAPPSPAPAPAAVTSAATILTPLPAEMPPPIPPPKMEQGIKPGVVIAVVAIVVLIGIGVIAAGVMLWPRIRERFVKPAAVAETTTQTATTTVAPPPSKISEASVNVVTSTSEPPPTATTIEEATTTTQPPITLSTTTNPLPPPRTETVAPPPVKPPRVEPREEPPPRDVEPSPPAQTGFVEPYVDGGGDDDTNERALANLKAQLRGVKRVEVHGGALEEVLKG